jgi:endonuclease/exonuclease/phosphatase family metal-dependent hydrolase
MKLISLNIGLFEKNNKELSAFIEEQHADILVLQEVVKRIDEKAYADVISKDTIDHASPELEFSFFSPVWILSHFEKDNFHGQEHFSYNLGGNVEFGSYVRSAFPILSGRTIFVQNSQAYITNWSSWPEEDYRAFQIIDLDVSGKKLRLINYHGIWSKDKQGSEKTKKACEHIRDKAREVDYPSIICGDFNLFPDTESMSVFHDHFINLPDQYGITTTRPLSNELNNAKRNVVDYILIDPSIHVDRFDVLKNDISDHLPLILNFHL